MKIGKPNDKQLTIIGASVAGVIALLLLFFAYRECKRIGPYSKLPGLLRMIAKDKPGGKSIVSQMAVVEAGIKVHTETIARREELEERLARMQADWNKLQEELPNDTNFADLMNAIYKGATEYNITIERITRDDPVPHDPNTNRVTLKLSGIQATYHDFGRFLYFLYVPLKRFIIVQDFSITSGAAEAVDTLTAKPLHKIEMKLVTFVAVDKNAPRR
ncbi:MAG: type 4a pilus biogenesis protein PilO [Planctomycetota bacterium]